MSPFAGLCPLCHFYLNFLCGEQVFPCHPKTSGGDLLNGRVQLGSKTFPEFTAFTAVGSAAQMIHGCGQTLVGFL